MLIPTCPACGQVPPPGRTYCNVRCRVRAHRARQRSPYQLAHVADPLPALRAPVTRVAALYVQADGAYADLDVDLWDEARDASRYAGPGPVVAHPPCSPWGFYRHRTPRHGAWLAVLAVEQVRRWGGVLEHPAGSDLWRALELPRPDEPPDRWGGRSYLVEQVWWGHPARKATWLYVVGTSEIPPVPAWSGTATDRIDEMDDKREREATPPAFARWLVALAATCRL